MLAMRPAGLAEWKITLADLAIANGSDLWRAVNGDREQKDHVISKPTAKDAFDCETSKATWEVIFQKLDLKWSNYFSEAEWHEWNRETLWGMLLNLSEDGSAQFGMVIPDEVEYANVRNVLRVKNPPKYLPKLPIKTKVYLEIDAGWSGQLILLEQNTDGGIDLLSPSVLMQDNLLTGEIWRLPQRSLPAEMSELIELEPVGTRYLWAGIFAELPEWGWLQGAREDFLDLQAEQLTDLLGYAQEWPERCRMWKTSYEVV
jgi:hypothetical protein